MVGLTYKLENVAAKRIHDSLDFQLTGDVLAYGEVQATNVVARLWWRGSITYEGCELDVLMDISEL